MILDLSGPEVCSRTHLHGPPRLWSLWDIMKQIHLPTFLELSNEIGRLHGVYSSMKPGEMTEATRENNKKVFQSHAARFEELDLQMCQQQCARLADLMVSGSPTVIAAQLTALLERMYDESRLRKFVTLSVRQAELVFSAEPLFGAEVNTKFPTAAFEIEEGGKCLGLERPTAAVFHCMRVMEIGIASVARCLGIPDPIKPAERNWGAILRSLKEEFDRRDKAALPAKWAQPDKVFFEDVYASLDAVRNPWRNATMHVENKYSPDEAEHIFYAVKAFMRKLASRLDEAGEPKRP